MKIARAVIAGVTLFAVAPLLAQPAATGTETIRPDDQSELQWASGVSQITPLPQAQPDAHLFGIVGGDPAMNGVQTYLTFFESPAEGYKIFRIGDFLNYTVLSHGPNRLLLSVRENYMGGRDGGTVGVRWRRLTISWRASRDDPPRSISITSTRGR